MVVDFGLEPELSVAEFREVLIASGLAERRPADDLARLEKMLRHADIIATARTGGRLLGVARAVSDFSYCCYLSDLAVDERHQRQGIGRRLVDAAHRAAGLDTTLILLAAPAARGYYAGIGMEPHERCWVRPRNG
jgi:GNAT superfamily N-acetyltransferase